MLIDFKSKESAQSENNSKAPTQSIEIIINNLECNKAFEKNYFFFDWIENRTKEAFLERLKEKLKHSEALARLECISLMNMMSQQPTIFEADDDDLITKNNQKLLLNGEKLFPYILQQNNIEDNGIYAWIMAENRQKNPLTHHIFHYGDNFFIYRKRHITTSTELTTKLIEWCGKIKDSKHLAFEIGYNFDDENYFDWDTSLLYKLPEKPTCNDHNQQPWKKLFAQANHPESSTLNKRQIRRQIDKHSRRAIKELQSTVTKWQSQQ